MCTTPNKEVSVLTCERPAPSYCTKSCLTSYQRQVNLGSWWTREENGKIYFSSHNDKFCNIFCIRSPWTTWLHARDTNSLDREFTDNCFGAPPSTFGFTSDLLFETQRLPLNSWPPPGAILSFRKISSKIWNSSILLFCCRQKGKTVKEDPWKDKKSKGCSLSRYGFSCVFNLPRGPGWGGGILWQTTT